MLCLPGREATGWEASCAQVLGWLPASWAVVTGSDIFLSPDTESHCGAQSSLVPTALASPGLRLQAGTSALASPCPGSSPPLGGSNSAQASPSCFACTQEGGTTTEGLLGSTDPRACTMTVGCQPSWPIWACPTLFSRGHSPCPEEKLPFLLESPAGSWRNEAPLQEVHSLACTPTDQLAAPSLSTGTVGTDSGGEGCPAAQACAGEEPAVVRRAAATCSKTSRFESGNGSRPHS